jgi:hypothetical protein
MREIALPRHIHIFRGVSAPEGAVLDFVVSPLPPGPLFREDLVTVRIRAASNFGLFASWHTTTVDKIDVFSFVLRVSALLPCIGHTPVARMIINERLPGAIIDAHNKPRE